MRRTEEFTMHSGRTLNNYYANSSDFRAPRVEDRTKPQDPPAAKNLQGWVIITLVVLLILLFLMLVILPSLLFVIYNSIMEQQAHLKINVKELGSKLEFSKQKTYENFTREVSDVEKYVKKFTSELEEQNEETVSKRFKEEVSDLQESVANIMEDLSEIETEDSSGSYDPGCSTGWTQYAFSCYYLSSSTQKWSISKKNCEDMMAHLIVVNDEAEMDFLRWISKGKDTWIGLTDSDGEWKWVDGTPYSRTPTFWEEKQPDDWKDHGLGGGEDCAAVRHGKQWNDYHCSHNFQYVCEKEML